VGSFKQAALVTQYFSGTEVRPSPCAGIDGAAVEAPSANPISELGGSITVWTMVTGGWLIEGY